MQPPTRQIHRLWVFGSVEQRQNSPQPLSVVSSNSLGRSFLEEGTQALMSKAYDHALSVTNYITLSKPNADANLVLQSTPPPTVEKRLTHGLTAFFGTG